MARGELFAIALIAIAALGLYHLQDFEQKLKPSRFQLWENLHGKSYSPMQREYRFSVWSQNLLYVQTHNELFNKGIVSYDLEMNMFADLTLQEFSSIYLIDYSGHQATGKCTGSQASTANLPEEIDWSAKGAVTGVKNQGQCGSCWAFSSTGSLEGALYRSNGTLASFSEQNLVDCSQSYGNNGCGGGWMNSSFFYVIDNGIALESKYPYHGVQGKCSYNPATDKAWRISNCVEVTVEKELSLQASVALNPVSVAIEANHASFQLYKSGVYTGNCGVKLDHGVLAVGYGTLSGKKYWKVKNSWGPTWGDKGYIFIENTGDGKGKCGIQMAASYPLP